MRKHLNTLLVVGTGLGLCLAAAMVQAQEADTMSGAEPAEPPSEDAGIRQSINDAAVTARIKSRLLLNEDTSGMRINVDTRNSEVTLNGTVESEAEKSLAEDIARSTKGVSNVQNQLTVAALSEESAPAAGGETGPAMPGAGQ